MGGGNRIVKDKEYIQNNKCKVIRTKAIGEGRSRFEKKQSKFEDWTNFLVISWSLTGNHRFG
jgi:hypothetical protein